MADGDVCTLESLKRWLALTDAAHDELLQEMIAAASRSVAAYLSRPLFVELFQELRTGPGGNRLTLRQAPVQRVLTVTIADQTIPEAPSAVAAGWREDGGTLYLTGFIFPRQPPLACAVTYLAGYGEEISDLPPDIPEATKRWIGLRFRERDRIGQVSKSLAGEVVTFAQADMPKDIARILGNYRRQVVW